MQYLKSGPPQLQDMSSRLNDWFERSMMISMALDFNKAIWSSAVRSLENKHSVHKLAQALLLTERFYNFAEPLVHYLKMPYFHDHLTLVNGIIQSYKEFLVLN